MAVRETTLSVTSKWNQGSYVIVTIFQGPFFKDQISFLCNILIWYLSKSCLTRKKPTKVKTRKLFNFHVASWWVLRFVQKVWFLFHHIQAAWKLLKDFSVKEKLSLRIWLLLQTDDEFYLVISPSHYGPGYMRSMCMLIRSVHGLLSGHLHSRYTAPVGIISSQCYHLVFLRDNLRT